MSLPLGVVMSSETLYWVATNGRTVYANVPTSRQVGRQFLCRVIENLALHAEESTGLVWISDRAQESELGEDRRDIRNARELLVSEGWLTDTGETRNRAKVWKLSLPGYTWATQNTPVSGRANGRANGRGVGRDNPPLTEQNRTTPLTPQREHKSEREQTPGGEGSKSDEVLAGCVERERITTPNARAGLVNHWRKEYRPLVSQALERDPDGQVSDLAQRCYNLRNGLATSPTSHAPAYEGGTPDCHHCNGAGYGLVRDTQGIATSRKCVCVGGTYEGETTLADLTPSQPSPTSHADIDPVKELRRQLRRVV
jgi:hypothetical protein